VIHNGVDTKYYHADKPTYREKYGDGFDHMLVFQGRIIKQKGLNYLLDAMPQILKEYPKTRLLIVGKGKEVPNLKQQVNKLGLQDNVVFPGFIPEEDINNMFSSADVFIMPSMWEVLCVALLEAMSCGRPLLASDATGNDEIVKHGVNGYVFPKRDNDAMMEKLRIMLDDKKLRNKMGKQSRKIAEKEFDWDIIADKTLKFYRNELANR
jgi:glycosyltransferase involved in cell wall biosynthesis